MKIRYKMTVKEWTMLTLLSKLNFTLPSVKEGEKVRAIYLGKSPFTWDYGIVEKIACYKDETFMQLKVVKSKDYPIGESLSHKSSTSWWEPYDY